MATHVDGDLTHAFASQVLGALEAAAVRITEEEIRKATAEFERRLRESIAGISFAAHRAISIRSSGAEIVISCRIERGEGCRKPPVSR